MSKKNAIKALKSLADADRSKAEGFDDLDQSAEARLQRAKEQGYDPDHVWYKGTGHDIKEMDTSGGRGKGYGTGAFFSSNPAVASTYALRDPKAGGGENVIPLLLKTGDSMRVDAKGANWNNITAETEIYIPARKVSNQQNIDALSDLGLDAPEPTLADMPEEWTTVGELFDLGVFEETVSTDDLARMARKKGLKGIVIDNVVDRGPAGKYHTPDAAKPSSIAAIFNPEDVRSVNAEFNPANKGSADILASVGGATTVAGAAILQSDETYASSTEENLELSMLRDQAGVDMDFIDQYSQPEESEEEETPWYKDKGILAENAIETVTQGLTGAVSDSIVNMNDTIKDMSSWGREQLGMDEAEYAEYQELFEGSLLDKVEPFEWLASLAGKQRDFIGEPDTVAGSVARPLGNILAPMGFYAKALKALGWTGTGFLSTAGRAVTAEALAGATALDPFDETFTAMLQEFGIENDFIDWMATKDTEAEGRVKNAIDAIVVGSTFEGTTKVAGTVAKKLLTSKAGMKLIAAMGSVWYARRLAKKDSPQVEAAAEIALQNERLSVLKSNAGDPTQPVYQHGAKSIEEVEINFARIETEDDVKALIQDLADSDIEEIDQARRGVVGWDQTKMEAGQIDAWEMLKSRNTGEPLNAAQTVAARQLWLQSSEKATSLARLVNVDPSPANMIAYKRQLVLHHAIQRQVLGARAETARALNAWKIPADAKDLQVITDQLANEQDILEIAKRHQALTEAGMVEAADTFVYGSAWAKGRDAVASMWYFSLLSGVKTHMRNIIGNSLVSVISPIEREIAAQIGRMKGSPQVEAGEGMAQLYGMLSGTMRALRVSRNMERLGTVWKSAKTGESGYGIGKIDQPMIGGFNTEKLGITKGSLMYYPAKVADAVVSAPGRALSAADEFFKTINYDGEIQALAYREARKKLKSGEIKQEDFWNEINRSTSNPDEYMELAGRAKAQRNTFTDTPEQTKVYKAWEGLSQVPVLGKLILPFRKTPYNIGLYTFERTPLAPLTKRFRDDMAAGGVRGDMAQAQLVMGNTLLLMGADAALNGSITGGGPADPKEREAWMQQHKPYSFEWVDENGVTQSRSYLGIEPIGTFLSTASSIVDILKTQDWEDQNKSTSDLALAASISIAATVTSQQYMRGLSDFFEMMNDPQRNAERYWTRLAGQMAVPTGVAQITQGIDSNFRYVGGMIDAIKSRTPGLSKSLPAVYDRWGEERTRASGLGPVYDGVSPFYAASIRPDPIDLEFSRLNKFFGKPNGRQSFYKSQGRPGSGIEINLKEHYPHAYWRLVELRGNGVTENINGAPIVVKSGGFVSSGKSLKEELNMIATGTHPHYPDEQYQMLTDGEDGGKQGLLMSIVNAYSKAAKDHLLQEFPDLRAEVEKRTNTPKYKFMESQ